MLKGVISLCCLVIISFWEYLCVKRHYGIFCIWEDEEHKESNISFEQMLKFC